MPNEGYRLKWSSLAVRFDPWRLQEWEMDQHFSRGLSQHNLGIYIYITPQHDEDMCAGVKVWVYEQCTVDAPEKVYPFGPNLWYQTLGCLGESALKGLFQSSQNCMSNAPSFKTAWTNLAGFHIFQDELNPRQKQKRELGVPLETGKFSHPMVGGSGSATMETFCHSSVPSWFCG